MRVHFLDSTRIYITSMWVVSKSDPRPFDSPWEITRRFIEEEESTRWGTEKENRKKRGRRKIATLCWPTIWAIHVYPTKLSVYQRAHASCSLLLRASFRAFSMPPFSSRHRSRRRRAHRNPFGKVGGKISFLVIPRGIPRVDHARRSV